MEIKKRTPAERLAIAISLITGVIEDMQEVVKCKDCSFYDDGYCGELDYPIYDENDSCPRGDRREE